MGKKIDSEPIISEIIESIEDLEKRVDRLEAAVPGLACIKIRGSK